MSLTGALNSAALGLQTTQGLSRIAADNVSNAMTPGYVRRQGVLVTPGAGQGGAIISEIRREVDVTLQRMSRLENSKMAQYQSIQEGLTGYTAYLGQPGDGTSPADKFNTFQNSLTTLSNLPSSNGAQAATVLAAEDLARSVRGAAVTRSEQQSTRICRGVTGKRQIRREDGYGSGSDIRYRRHTCDDFGKRVDQYLYLKRCGLARG